MDPRTRTLRARRKATAGFTIIELAIVVVILGILAIMAIPNFLRAQERTKRASCLSNQRNLIEATLLYCSDTGVRDGVVNGNVIHANGYVGDEMCECPASNDGDNDDYEITLVDGDITQVVCLVRGIDHQLSF